MKYRVVSGDNTQKKNSGTTQEEREFSFPGIQDPKTRSHVESVVRNNPARGLFRAATHALSGVVSGSANLAGLAESGINAAQKLVTGKDIPGHALIQKSLPTTRNVVNAIESATAMELGGSPQTENSLDRFISNTASFASPNKLLGGIGKLVGFSNLGKGIPLVRAAKIAGAGQAGRQAAKYVGAGEGGQLAAELGASLWAGRGTERVSSRLDKIKEQSYEKAQSNSSALNQKGNADSIQELTTEALRPFEKKIVTQGLNTKGDIVEKTITKPSSTVATASDKLTRKAFESINNSIKDGELTVEKAIDHKRRLNNYLKDWSANPAIPKAAKTKFRNTVGALNEFIEKNTKESHPEFWNNWNTAESIARGQAPLPKEAQTLAKEVASEVAKKGMGAAIGALVKGTWGALTGSIVQAGIQRAVQNSKQFSQLIKESPAAKELYFELLGDIAMTNIPQVERSISKLNEIAKKKEFPSSGKFTVVRS